MSPTACQGTRSKRVFSIHGSILPRIENETTNNKSLALRGNPSAPYRNNNKDALVRRYLARARKANSDAQSYGGSVGGAKSLDRGGRGIVTLGQRSAEQASKAKVFDEAGRGALGARSAAWEVKKDIYPTLGT